MRDLCIFLLFCSVSCLLFDLVPGKSRMGKSPILLVEVLYSYGVYITTIYYPCGDEAESNKSHSMFYVQFANVFNCVHLFLQFGKGSPYLAAN